MSITNYYRKVVNKKNIIFIFQIKISLLLNFNQYHTYEEKFYIFKSFEGYIYDVKIKIK
jgi:hypothetical protein